MNKPNVDDLREALFDTLRGLQSGSLEIDRAKAISEVAQTIINTAKVEVEMARATGAAPASGFLAGSAARALPAEDVRAGEVFPGVTSRVHRLQG